MPISQYVAKLSEKTLLGEKFTFYKFELVSPNTITFRAGQYLLLNCPTTPQKRQYSIVSAPRLDHAIELLVETIPGGQASGYLSSLALGGEISFFAPAGEFVISDEIYGTSEPLVFIGTGSGIAPLRSQILDLLRTRESTREITLYWGMREAVNLFWIEQLEELSAAYPNFHFHLVLSRPPEGWTLCSGRVTQCLSVHDLPPSAHYYICGNSQMITDVMGVLSTRNVASDHIHHEKFI